MAAQGMSAPAAESAWRIVLARILNGIAEEGVDYTVPGQPWLQRKRDQNVMIDGQITGKEIAAAPSIRQATPFART